MRGHTEVTTELPTLVITSDEANSIADLASELAKVSSTTSPARFLRRARVLVDGHAGLGRIRTVLGTHPSACRIAGLRVDTTVPTPTSPLSTFEYVAQPAATLGLIANVAGSHRGFDRESSGRLIHSIAPIAANRDLQISSSSSVELELHTELAYAECMPDFVLLLCVEPGTETAATQIASLDEILCTLPDAVLRILYEPRFMTSVDVVVRDRPERRIGPMPILHATASGDVTIRCDFGEVEPTDDASAAALSALRNAARRSASRIVLNKGDLLVISNKRALHGRLPYAARFDGADRWLLRAYVWASRSPVKTTGAAHVVDGSVMGA